MTGIVSVYATFGSDDEARGIKHPRIWTARRDVDMWKSIA